MAEVTTDWGPAITRYDFHSGALRRSHFTLYPSCLVHRSEGRLETVPLAAIASLRVAYERDLRKLGWGVGLLIIALILFLIAGPLAGAAGAAAEEMAAAGTHGVARALNAVFLFFHAVASALPLAAAACLLGGLALGALGYLGSTTLVLDLAGSQRSYPVRGRNAGLVDFAEAVAERLMSLKR